MLFAEFDWLALLSDKGLAVTIVLAVMFAMWRGVQFAAPLAKNFVESTVSLHNSLKETSIKQTALMDDHSSRLEDHSDKLSDIRLALTSNRCLMAATQPTQEKPPV